MHQDFSIVGSFNVKATLGMLRCHDLIGGKKVRIGRAFDGGYVMYDCFAEITKAYSLGINDDVSWDFEIAQLGIDCYQYDHTIEQLPFEHERFHWQKRGIGWVPSEELDTLPNLIAANGHQDEENMLLKCDIEGGEWMAFAEMPNATLRQFSQIVVEMHGLGDLCIPASAFKARQAIRNLTASHFVVHVHANNFGNFSVVGGAPVPDVIELTLLRKDMGDFAPSEHTFPTPIDQPCSPDRVDLTWAVSSSKRPHRRSAQPYARRRRFCGSGH